MVCTCGAMQFQNARGVHVDGVCVCLLDRIAAQERKRMVAKVVH